MSLIALVACTAQPPTETGPTSDTAQPPVPATVTGDVVEYGTTTPSPQEGAKVRWIGGDATTTTDAGGAFSIDVEIGTVELRASQPSYLGLEEERLVPAEGLALHWELVPESGVTFVDAALGITSDPTTGVIRVELDDDSGGYTPIVDAEHGPPFTFDANGNVVATESTLPGGEPRLFFPNVAAGRTGVRVDGCSPVDDLPDRPVDASIVTLVRFDCL